MSITELLKKIIGDKKEYRQMTARIKALPDDYQYVFEKIQKSMGGFAAGDGYDMMKLHYELLDLFETGAAEERQVLEITGEDVAAFCDELLRNAKTYTEKRRDQLNREIIGRLGSKK